MTRHAASAVQSVEERARGRVSTSPSPSCQCRLEQSVRDQLVRLKPTGHGVTVDSAQVFIRCCYKRF